MLDEYIRSASISEGDMVDGRYAELESRYLDAEGKVKKYRDERSDRKYIATGQVVAYVGVFLEYSEDMFRVLSAGSLSLQRSDSGLV